MTKAGKSMATPKLRFPEFRGGSAWNKQRLGDISNVKASGDLDSKLFSETQSGSFSYPVYSNAVECNGLYGYYSVPQYCKDSVTITARGTLGVAFHRDHDFMGIGRLLVVSNIQNLNSYFLAECWNHLIVIPYEVTSIPQLTAIAARAIVLPIPSIEEQTKIADCLTSLDEVIAAQGRKVEALKTYKRGLMQQFFPREGETIPRLRFPEFRDAPEWRKAKAGELFANRSEKGNDDLPIYSVTMTDGLVKRSSLDRRIDDITNAEGNKKTYKHDIAYNMMRMWQGACGVAYEECMVSPAYVVLSPQAGVHSDFYGYLFKLPQMLRIFTSHSRGLTEDRLRLYYQDFCNILLPHPDICEQQRIADCFHSLNTKITAESEKFDALKTHKKGLMQQLFPSTDVD